MSVTSVATNGGRLQRPREPRTRLHRGVSLRSRAVLLGAGLGIRSLVAAWMAAPDFPWPTALIDDAARWLPRPSHTQISEVALAHCPAEWVRAERCGTVRAILYLHGGAFLSCGLNTHRPLVSCLSRSADAPVLNVGYRMLPRYPISSAVADALDGYRWLQQAGYGDGDIVVAGDSAGGYLAFMTALSIPATELPKPAAVVAISPLTDIGPDRAGCGKARRCPVFPRQAAIVFARYLARAHSRITVNGQEGPLTSPVAEDLHDMPPVMIRAGADELLAGDAELMADRLRASGVPCDLHLWAGQMHAFVVAANATPESRRAIKSIGQFVQVVTTHRPSRHNRPAASTSAAAVAS
jgi:acetyl esterase/lipase